MREFQPPERRRPDAATADGLVVTCEHGGNRIPAQYRPLFAGYRALLDSHRGFDAGALVVATELAADFRAPLFTSAISRLLIDLNRSIGHPRLFSEATRRAPAAMRDQIVALHYRPYRTRVEQCVLKLIRSGRQVVHVSSHSFTPELHGTVRNADVGLLYDPARAGETALCAQWKSALVLRAPDLRVRRNYPYAGKGDGLTRYFRSRFSPEAYVGIELEINQNRVRRDPRHWAPFRRVIVASLADALARDRADSAARPECHQEAHP